MAEPTTPSQPTLTVRRAQITSPRAHAILLATWALLLGLSFPPMNLWPLAHIALVPLTLLAIRSARPRLMLLGVWLVGSAWWLVMAWWVMLTTVPGGITLGFYLALYGWLYAWTIRAADRRFNLPLVFTVPIVWLGFEYLRGSWVLTGFPWFNLGQSQPTVMIQIADTVGAYGVSFVVAMTSGMICDLLMRSPIDPAKSGWRRWGVPVRISMPAWLIVTGATLVWGTVAMVTDDLRPDIELETQSLRVAVVQTNVPQSNKEAPTEAQDRKNFDDMVRMTRKAAAESPKPGLIVWPETMVPRPLNGESVEIFRRSGGGEDTYHNELLLLVRETGVPMIVGAHKYDWTGDGRTTSWNLQRRYNSAYLVEPGKRIDQRFDKVHRVPFGEYIPGTETFPALKEWMLSLTPYDYDYTLGKGRSYTVFEVPGPGGRVWRAATPICFEDVVSYVPRKMVYAQDGTKRTDLLVNLSNDGWFIGSSELVQHRQIARFRCVENRVPMARAVNRGASGFIDSSGRLIGGLAGSPVDWSGYDVHDLALDPRTTVFGRIGDAFAAACLAATLALITANLVARIRSRKAKP